MNDTTQFAQDVYDVLGMNTNFLTQEDFYYKYVKSDDAFMVDAYKDHAVIYFDNYKITITKA